MRIKVAATLTFFMLVVTLSVFGPSADAQRGRGDASRPNVSTTPTPSAPKIETSGGPKTETKGPKRRIGTPTATELVDKNVSTERKAVPATPQVPDPRTSPETASGAKTAVIPYVGVIAGASGCPPGSSLVTLYMDAEDHNNANSFSGWVGAIVQDKNTAFKFCRVDGSQFSSPAYAPYAVLQLEETCPSGSYSFSRYFDNEDYKNANSFDSTPAVGISVNFVDVLNSSTRLYFCLFSPSVFPPVGTSGAFPDLGIEYGVFAPNNLYGILDTGSLFIDDEDDANENSYDATYHNKIWETSQIISGDRNTHLQIAKVKSGPPLPNLHSVSLNVSSVEGGNNGRNPMLTVALDGPAPPGGMKVEVSSSKPNIAWVMGSGYFMIPAGKTSENWDYFLGTKNVLSNKSLTLTVRVNNKDGYVNLDVTK